MRLTPVSVPNTSCALSRPMRLDCPPTRMNPSTSNMRDNMLLLSSNLGYSESSPAIADPSELRKQNCGSRTYEISKEHYYNSRRLNHCPGWINQRIRPGRIDQNRSRKGNRGQSALPAGGFTTGNEGHRPHGIRGHRAAGI